MDTTTTAPADIRCSTSHSSPPTGPDNGQPFPSPIPVFGASASPSQHQRQLVQLHSHHRRPGVLLSQHLALHRELQPLRRARTGAQHLPEAGLCRLAGASSSGAHLGQSRQRGALPQRQSAQPGRARHRRPAAPSTKAESSPRPTAAPYKSGDRSTHRLTASPIRRPSASPTTTRCEASVRHTSEIAGGDGRLHLRQVAR